MPSIEYFVIYPKDDRGMLDGQRRRSVGGSTAPNLRFFVIWFTSQSWLESGHVHQRHESEGFAGVGALPTRR